MLLDDDTIAAISTPIGRGAIAIVRVCGRDAHRIGRLLFDRWPVEPRRSVLVNAFDPSDGSLLDRGLVTRFDDSHSYTGEPMFEFSGHGGITAPVAVLGAVLRIGARQARSGEFTQRALLNNKLDLLQAEGIAELVDAQTDAHRRIAVSQVQGGLSAIVEQLQGKLIELEALIAYDLDFPEEDDGPVPRGRIREVAADVLSAIERLLETVVIGEIARTGALVVIAGRPNAGKSSLFNALLGEERAIVTEHPGTTRDAIEAVLDDAEIPLRLVDTAGLREMSDAVERLGIEVSKRHLSRAHVVLACADRAEELQDAAELVRVAGASAPVIGVLTKSDLATSGKTLSLSDGVIAVSALQRTGLAELLDRVRDVVRTKLGEIEISAPVVTRARQQVALTSAKKEVGLFLTAWQGETLPSVVAAVHVRSAIHALQELVGRIDAETILGEVFERFCVGK